jgi:hypothetical protein
VQLWGTAGYGVDIRVVGYQFPDADDWAQRCSWHLVEGTAGPAAALSFLEPNLSLTLVGWARRAALIDVGLDLEFAPPWQPEARKATRTGSGVEWTESIFSRRRTTGTRRPRRIPTINSGQRQSTDRRAGSRDHRR